MKSELSYSDIALMLKVGFFKESVISLNVRFLIFFLFNFSSVNCPLRSSATGVHHSHENILTGLYGNRTDQTSLRTRIGLISDK